MPIVDLPGFLLVNGQQARGCPHMRVWLPVFNTHLIFIGAIKHHVDIAQAAGGYFKSGNTHRQGTALDLINCDKRIVAAAREAGAPATWGRGPWVEALGASSRALGFSDHIHLGIDCPCVSGADYQTAEVKRGGDGLVGNGKDYHPRPSAWRDYKQGIAWMQNEMKPKVRPISYAATMSTSVWNRRQVQTALQRQKFYSGPIDGVFGPVTRDALRRWQRAVGAPATGHLDVGSFNKLVRWLGWTPVR